MAAFRSVRTMVAASTLVAGVLLTAACSSSSPTPLPSSSSSATASGSTTAAAPISTASASGGTSASGPAHASTTAKSTATSIPGQLPAGVTPGKIPTSVANNVDARKGVAITKCAATEDGWQAVGTAENSGKSAREFKITIFFTTTSATVINSTTTSVKIDAGKTAKWTASGKFKAASEMRCVLRGVA